MVIQIKKYELIIEIREIPEPWWKIGDCWKSVAIKLKPTDLNSTGIAKKILKAIQELRDNIKEN